MGEYVKDKEITERAIKALESVQIAINDVTLLAARHMIVTEIEEGIEIKFKSTYVIAMIDDFYKFQELKKKD